eukprot:CAMPEP_0203674432 /NCGR_PEP_ID=MMETSP0090-20130426/16167_1 /ASSEMBLY_ACC=CAM_ASM_001088 /TAXON_ID=426623 /ORGANISM="Chaetoceros affinis, Strain CCMP159" /LENGTH=473 /DNA_ID=CAMNT_0050540305 /DNA_START=66 /DNA_END=1487 /DNA_ORIENTATION=+
MKYYSFASLSLFTHCTLLLPSLTPAQFPLENPCLQTCSITDITPETLQTCVDKCFDAGHCCGNRLVDDPNTAANLLSCANGCEIAYYRSTVEQCKADCVVGNNMDCEYQHPNIPKMFDKCYTCNCQEWPPMDACEQGCELAATLEDFYQYVEPTPGSCDQEQIPRFLFGGQSNMEGSSDQALPGSFRTILRLLNKKGLSKSKMRNMLKRHMNKAEASTMETSRNQSRFIYGMRKHLRKRDMFYDHPTSTCSFTNPSSELTKLDCERPVAETGCGANGYGPEFMFGHMFPKRESPLQGMPIGIAKVAAGGTEIYKNWMKDNKDEVDNHWYALVDTIKGARGSLEGFVWFQGENDSFEDWNKANYFDNLTKFVADVRQEIYSASNGKFSTPEDVPVVICELGNWIYGIDTAVLDAQRAFVENDSNSILVPTGAGPDPFETMTAFYHYDAASMLVIGNRIASAMAKLLQQNADIFN